MAAHPPFIPDYGLRAGVANEPSHCAARMIAIRASDRIVVTLSSTRSFKAVFQYAICSSKNNSKLWETLQMVPGVKDAL